MSVLQDFKKFAMRGNVVDLAVGVIIGSAFGQIVNSMVKDVVMPLVNFIIGGQVDFTNKLLVLRAPENYTGPYTYDALTKAGAIVFAYGNFVTILINFILLAFIIFWMVRLINKAKHQEPPAPKVTPEDILLLREIRDELKKVSPATPAVPTTADAGPPKP